MRKVSVASILALVSSQAIARDDLMMSARQIFRPIPKVLPAIRDNPVTPEKVELGKKLFFDPRISVSGIISCNTCHNLGTGGVDAGPTSVGHGWQKGPRRAPTVYNSVFNVAQFWDGRAPDLKAQAKGPVQASAEMNATPDHVTKTLNSMDDYVGMFKQAFPRDTPSVSFDNFAKAIEAFESTLTTPAAPFDQYLNGNASALNDQQKAGLKLFMDKGCSSCHRGINIGGQDYFPFGVVGKPDAKLLPTADKGRFVVTNAVGDEYVFRVAPLRNVALRAPYFHSGQVWSLEEAVGIMGEVQLGTKLDDKERSDIAAFLNALTGHLPNIEYPMLPTRTNETPPPSLGR
ncbi:cytochrome C peroxidase [Bradyrhizobium centrolobii]|uniref:Cytochrome C peroxidase n=2 Tax=Bradyrhizobium TaxID=374 RepID=A0A176ZFD5_9BRAD|nr:MULTISPECIES: cytochrome-c peroxidase [Bradyrhizobium]OAF07246.1 cytochrome C peroxidase [Bradyrhizobium centrolobii]OAF19259.1 cytochrome C peroxidase [Bradyrhizobium neotropicale]